MARAPAEPGDRVARVRPIATAFDIRDWVVAAIKCYVGHSLGPAAGDQTTFGLGSLATARCRASSLPEFASDVHQERLSLSNRHRSIRRALARRVHQLQGLRGNNATGLCCRRGHGRLLERAHGAAAMHQHAKRNEAIRVEQQRQQGALLEGHDQPIYDFGLNVVEGTALGVERTEIRIPATACPSASTWTILRHRRRTAPNRG